MPFAVHDSHSSVCVQQLCKRRISQFHDYGCQHDNSRSDDDCATDNHDCHSDDNRVADNDDCAVDDDNSRSDDDCAHDNDN